MANNKFNSPLDSLKHLGSRHPFRRIEQRRIERARRISAANKEMQTMPVLQEPAHSFAYDTATLEEIEDARWKRFGDFFRELDSLPFGHDLALYREA